jgi:hypothetical protein
MYNVDVEDGGSTGGNILANSASLPCGATWFTHEMGHSFGLLDSFDESPRETWDVAGVYCDPHDIMSAMSVYVTRSNQNFPPAGPILNAAAMDLLGWLDHDRVWKPSPIDYGPQTFTLKSLSHPDATGYMAAKWGEYYLEFRTPDNWDAGIPRATVLIHTIPDYVYDGRTYKITKVIAKSPGPATECWDHEFLQGDSTQVKNYYPTRSETTIETLTIKVEKIDVPNREATISIKSAYQRIPSSINIKTVDLEALFAATFGPSGGVIYLPDGSTITIPPRDRGFVFGREMINTLGTLYDAKNIKNKDLRLQVMGEIFVGMEKSIQKAKKQFGLKD